MNARPGEPALGPHFPSSTSTSRRGLFRAAGVAVALPIVLPRGAKRANAQAIVQTESRYFAETGHNLSNPFLERWKLAGGQEVLGLPLSEERFEEGVGVVQTFETVTLVYDPSLAAPWDVQALHLSSAVTSALIPASARRQVSGCSSASSFCQFFPDTGHTISERIGSFWGVSGDLPMIGLPLSEPFKESGSGLTIQVFERAVLEDHGANDVRLRPLARQIADDSGLSSDPAFLPAPPSGGTTRLIRAEGGLRLRSSASADAEIIAVLPDNAEFIAVAGSTNEAWTPGYADGYAGWVARDFLKPLVQIEALSEKNWDPNVWQGIALGETNVRAKPTTSAPIAETLAYGDSLTVVDWVKGEEVFIGADIWAQVGDDAFIYARNVGRNAPVVAPPLPLDAPTVGNWIDVHLTQQLMTAYSGRNVVRVTVMTSGVPGWETPPGFYSILSRVANETMTSGAIGAEHFYKLEDVLFTQYFTDLGHAIHFAWWRTPETIGRPGSHGCLNLLLDDSRFYWDWATIGTPVYVHV